MLVAALWFTLGAGLLTLLGFALRLTWLRTAPHFATASDLGKWMLDHNVDRVVIRRGQLTVAERLAPAPDVPPDAPEIKERAGSKSVDDEVREAFETMARERREYS